MPQNWWKQDKYFTDEDGLPAAIACANEVTSQGGVVMMHRRFILSTILLGSAATASPLLAQSDFTTYKYDALGRLVEASEISDGTAADADRYCYDEAGNRTQHLSDTDGVAPACGATSGGDPPPEGDPPPDEEPPEPPPQPPPNNAPIANDDSANGYCNVSGTIDVLENDTDPDHDPLQLDSITFSESTGGSATATGSSNGLVVISFGATEGVTTFDYVVSDGRGRDADGVLTVLTLNSCGGSGGPYN